MKYNFKAKLMGKFYHGMCKKGLKSRGVDPATIKGIMREYKVTVLRAKDIGNANLIASYFMGAYFIAMNRTDGLSPDDNFEIMKEGIETSKLFKSMMGDAKSYFDPKRTEKRKIWSAESKKRKYENDWVVDILDKTEDYELGYDYHECGVCKLFRDEGCFEWAKYLCALDFPIAKVMGLHLERTKTLAEGGDFCDFRYSYENPEDKK